jgi:phage tail sheath protein FI
MPLAIGLQFTQGSPVLATAPSSGVIAIVGTAAIGTKDTPFLIKSMDEAIARFGYPTAGSTIPDALERAYKSYGQIPFVGVNVAGTAAATVAEADFTFDAQDRIQLPHRHVTLVVVKNSAGLITYVADTDYTIDPAKAIIQRKGSAIAAGATVKIAYSRPDFSAITATQIIGGVNATTGKREGLEALIDAEFVDLNPSNITDIITPGFSTTTVATKLATMAARLRAQYYLDAPATATIQQVLEGRSTGASPVAHFATKDANAILCYPNVIIGSGASAKEEWYSIHVACARAIAAEWQAPTNLEVRGVTSWKTALLTSASDPLADNSRLVENGVVTYMNVSGQNPVIWGHFNASYKEENTTKKGLDQIHVIRIINSVYDQVEKLLRPYIGVRLGVNWKGAIAIIEAEVSRQISESQSIDFGKIRELPLLSDLSSGKLAFELTVQIPGVLNLIRVDLIFVI